MDINKAVGQAIKSRRLKFKLSMKDVAKALSRTRQAYSNIESGAKIIDVVDLQIIAKELSCKISDLIPDEFDKIDES